MGKSKHRNLVAEEEKEAALAAWSLKFAQTIATAVVELVEILDLEEDEEETKEEIHNSGFIWQSRPKT